MVQKFWGTVQNFSRVIKKIWGMAQEMNGMEFGLRLFLLIPDGNIMPFLSNTARI